MAGQLGLWWQGHVAGDVLRAAAGKAGSDQSLRRGGGAGGGAGAGYRLRRHASL